MYFVRVHYLVVNTEQNPSMGPDKSVHKVEVFTIWDFLTLNCNVKRLRELLSKRLNYLSNGGKFQVTTVKILTYIACPILRFYKLCASE